MSLKTNDKELRLQRYIQAARDAGIKLTHQRLEIFRELASHTEHPDIETIYKSVKERIPTISLDTVYRAFAMLERENILERVSPFSGRARFDLNTNPHHHFVCKVCGKVLDFFCADADRFKIPDEVLSWGKVNQTYLELRGVCTDCS